jgi:hypothetical protein
MSTTPEQQKIQELGDRVYDLEQDLYNTKWKADYLEEFSNGYFVNVYEVDRHYGGPEEGGWWFDAGHVVHSFHLINRTEAESLIELLRQQFTDTGERYSMAARYDDYRVVLEATPGADYPTERPHYE